MYCFLLLVKMERVVKVAEDLGALSNDSCVCGALFLVSKRLPVAWANEWTAAMCGCDCVGHSLALAGGGELLFSAFAFLALLARRFFSKKAFKMLWFNSCRMPLTDSKLWLLSGSAPRSSAPPTQPIRRVGEAVIDLADAGNDQRAGAHRAGLFSDVERALVEAPIADEAGRLRDREDLGVGGGVVGGAGLVVGGCDDLAVVFDDCADRHLVLVPGFDRLIVGVGHEEVGIAVERGWVDFFEWAVCLHGLKVYESGRSASSG